MSGDRARHQESSEPCFFEGRRGVDKLADLMLSSVWNPLGQLLKQSGS